MQPTTPSFARRAAARGSCLGLALVAATSTLALSAEAHAGGPAAEMMVWLEEAYSSLRQGVAPAAELTNPAVIWSYYLGGRVDATDAWVGDAEGDGLAEIVVVTGGSATCFDPQGGVRWRLSGADAAGLHSVQDLDKDGDAEALILGADTLSIVDMRDGRVLYRLGLMGGDVEVRDIDGDEALELVVAEGGRSGGVVRAFDFSLGVEDGLLRWQFDQEMSDAGVALEVVQAQGDVWHVRITDADGRRLVAVDARSGALLEGSGEPLLRAQETGCGPLESAQLGGGPERELIAVGAETDLGANDAVHLSAFDPTTNATLWSHIFGTRPTLAAVRTLPSGAAHDLDGDGDAEVIASVFDNAGGDDSDGIFEPERWVAAVYDGMTGQAIDYVPDALAVAVLRDDAGPILVTRAMAERRADQPELAELTAWRLTEAGLEPLATLDRAQAIGRVQALRGDCAARAVWGAAAPVDLNEDGVMELLVRRDSNGDGAADQLLRLAGAAWDAPLATSAVGGEALAVLGAAPGQLGADGAVALMRGDGAALVLDDALAVVRTFDLGGFVQPPRVAQWDTASEAPGDTATFTPWVIVRDSQGRITSFDAREAGAPALAWQTGPVWDRRAFTAVAWGDQGDFSAHGVVVQRRAPSDATLLEMYRPDGELLWSQELEGAEAAELLEVTGVWSGVVALRRGETLRLELRDAQDGALTTALELEPEDLGAWRWSERVSVWSQSERVFVGYGDRVAVFALDDNGEIVLEGTLDWAQGHASSLALATSDGPRVASRSVYGDVAVSDAEGAQDWVWATQRIGVNRAPSRMAVVPSAEEGESDRLLVPQARGWLVLLDGTDGSVLQRMCLQGGQAELTDAGDVCQGGTLSAPVFARIDLEASSEPSDVAIVGSSDGWLYAISPDGALEWSYFLGAALSAPVLADANGDGTSEVLVSAGDGYVYVLGQSSVPALRGVFDVAVDAQGDIIDAATDIDTLPYVGHVGFAWEEVPEIAAYRATVIDREGTQVVPWTELGAARSWVLPVDALGGGVGRVFRVVVEPRNDAGETGRHAVSDGVEVVYASPEIDAFSVDLERFSPGLGQAATFDAAASDALGLSQASLKLTPQGQALPVATQLWQIDEDGAWSAQTTWSGLGRDDAPLEDGAYDATLTVFNAAGMRAERTLALELDSTGPAAPTIDAPVDGALLSDAVLEVSGAVGIDAVSVEVFAGEAPLCTVTPDDEGGFACAGAEALEDGAYALSARALDDLGNPGLWSDDANILIDTTAPEAPAFTSPASGSLLATTTPELGLSAEANARIEVRADGSDVLVCDVRADAQGAATCTPDAALAEGEVVLTAVAIDGAGNVSAPSEPLALVLDTTAPDAPVFNAPADGATLDTSEVVLALTAEPSAEVAVYSDGDDRLICAASADASGLATCTTAALADGDYALYAIARDAAGNLSAPSGVLRFAINTAPDTGGDNNSTGGDSNNGTTGGTSGADDGDTSSASSGANGDDGCGCAVPARPTRAPWAPAALGLALAWAALVRRRRR